MRRRWRAVAERVLELDPHQGPCRGLPALLVHERRAKGEAARHGGGRRVEGGQLGHDEAVLFGEGEQQVDGVLLVEDVVERRIELLLLPGAQLVAAVGRRYAGGAPRLVEQQQRGAAHLAGIGLQAEHLGLQVGIPRVAGWWQGWGGGGGQQRGAAHVLDIEDAVAVDVAKEAARSQRALTAAALGLGL